MANLNPLLKLSQISLLNSDVPKNRIGALAAENIMLYRDYSAGSRPAIEPFNLEGEDDNPVIIRSDKIFNNLEFVEYASTNSPDQFKYLFNNPLISLGAFYNTDFGLILSTHGIDGNGDTTKSILILKDLKLNLIRYGNYTTNNTIKVYLKEAQFNVNPNHPYQGIEITTDAGINRLQPVPGSEILLGTINTNDLSIMSPSMIQDPTLRYNTMITLTTDEIFLSPNKYYILSFEVATKDFDSNAGVGFFGLLAKSSNDNYDFRGNGMWMSDGSQFHQVPAPGGYPTPRYYPDSAMVYYRLYIPRIQAANSYNYDMTMYRIYDDDSEILAAITTKFNINVVISRLNNIVTIRDISNDMILYQDSVNLAKSDFKFYDLTDALYIFIKNVGIIRYSYNKNVSVYFYNNKIKDLNISANQSSMNLPSVPIELWLAIKFELKDGYTLPMMFKKTSATLYLSNPNNDPSSSTAKLVDLNVNIDDLIDQMISKRIIDSRDSIKIAYIYITLGYSGNLGLMDGAVDSRKYKAPPIVSMLGSVDFTNNTASSLVNNITARYQDRQAKFNFNNNVYLEVKNEGVGVRVYPRGMLVLIDGFLVLPSVEQFLEPIYVAPEYITYALDTFFITTSDTDYKNAIYYDTLDYLSFSSDKYTAVDSVSIFKGLASFNNSVICITDRSMFILELQDPQDWIFTLQKIDEVGATNTPIETSAGVILFHKQLKAVLYNGKTTPISPFFDISDPIVNIADTPDWSYIQTDSKIYVFNKVYKTITSINLPLGSAVICKNNKDNDIYFIDAHFKIGYKFNTNLTQDKIIKYNNFFYYANQDIYSILTLNETLYNNFIFFKGLYLVGSGTIESLQINDIIYNKMILDTYGLNLSITQEAKNIKLSLSGYFKLTADILAEIYGSPVIAGGVYEY